SPLRRGPRSGREGQVQSTGERGPDRATLDALVALLEDGQGALDASRARLVAAERSLVEIEDLLSALIADDRVTDSIARHVEALRDDLGGSLLAAAEMQRVGVRDEAVVDVLRRALDAINIGVTAI